ncbi:ensconsin-like [Panicum virgatum]|uniref:Uncharacterized protein n=1 Tax=Panicum virgatum TaxID=38727 RepID=A0A8T0WUS1_PANVG|nr:ensconsin-like [Panicum virgatum]KAG2653281.1 hypothetical protein PVAP13_1NG443200 [Panicum virgatum]
MHLRRVTPGSREERVGAAAAAGPGRALGGTRTTKRARRRARLERGVSAEAAARARGHKPTTAAGCIPEHRELRTESFLGRGSKGGRNISASMQSQAPGREPGRAPAKRKQRRPAGHDDETDDDERRRKTPLRGLLRDFLEQQLRLEVQRHEMMERQARERLFFEEQWRQSMQRMERERLVLERVWMEREEQRRMKEEARAERRDQLLTSLLTSLLHGDL